MTKKCGQDVSLAKYDGCLLLSNNVGAVLAHFQTFLLQLQFQRYAIDDGSYRKAGAQQTDRIGR